MGYDWLAFRKACGAAASRRYKSASLSLRASSSALVGQTSGPSGVPAEARTSGCTPLPQVRPLPSLAASSAGSAVVSQVLERLLKSLAAMHASRGAVAWYVQQPGHA